MVFLDFSLQVISGICSHTYCLLISEVFLYVVQACVVVFFDSFCMLCVCDTQVRYLRLFGDRRQPKHGRCGHAWKDVPVQKCQSNMSIVLHKLVIKGVFLGVSFLSTPKNHWTLL